MATLSAPTLLKVATEGLKRGGRRNPTAGEITDAQDEYLKAVISRIHQKVKSHPLLKTVAYDVTIKGQHTYALPSAYREVESIILLDGPDDWRGTSQTGGTGSVTLAASFDADSDVVIGKKILMTSGAEVDTYKQIVGYNNTTKVVTPHSAWSTGPGTDTYLIVDTEIPLYPTHKKIQIDTLINRGNIMRPTRASVVDENIFLDHPPDKIYGLEIWYYTNLMDEDLTGTVWVNVLREWYRLIMQGIAVETMQRFDDERYPAENAIFEGMLNDISNEESEILKMEYYDC